MRSSLFSNYYAGVFICFFVMSCAVSAQNQPPKQPGGEPTLEGCDTPIIHSLGASPYIVFEHDNLKPHFISVNGQNLSKQCTADTWIRIDAPHALTYSEDFRKDWKQSDKQLVIEISPSVFRRAETGDRLQVTVMLNSKKPDSLPHEFQKTFILFSREDYRKHIVDRHVKVGNFAAAPTSYEETEELFGKWIADHFYTLRLTIFNDSDQDQIVSISRIKVGARVLVTPHDSLQKDLGIGQFTVPIDLFPMPLTHVYSILDNVEKYSPRTQTFRALRFAGTLGSLYGAAYGNSMNSSVGWGLWSSDVVPALDALFPNKWPTYESNVVTKAMPDLIRIPSQATNDHAGQFLFFSKDRIEALMGDQALFKRDTLKKGKNVRPDGPAIHTISIDLGSMLIPFEVLTEPGEKSFRNELASLGLQLNNASEGLAKIAQLAGVYRGLNIATLSLVKQDELSLTNLAQAVTTKCQRKAEQACVQASKALLALQKLGDEELSQFPAVLLDDERLGQSATEALRSRVDLMTRAALAGEANNDSDKALTQVENQIKAINAHIYHYDLFFFGLRRLLSSSAQKNDQFDIEELNVGEILEQAKALLKTVDKPIFASAPNDEAINPG